MTPLFADASSIILLEKAGLFPLLLNSYHVIVSRRVLKEITHTTPLDAAGFSLQVALKRLHIMVVPKQDLAENYRGLEKMDPGERDTIILYLVKKTGSDPDR